MSILNPARRKTPTIRPGSEPSWWLQEALRAEGSPPAAAPLSGAVDADVAIVGGGYTGLWTALSLRQKSPGLKIVLVESAICGSGASGKNGGLVHGYWNGISKFAKAFGDDAAVEIAHLGSRAQDALRTFCTSAATDVWWHERGILKLACSPGQDAAVQRTVDTARRLGASDKVVPLSAAEVQFRCRSPVFRCGAWITEGAHVQPARLVRELRRTAIARGITVYENTHVMKVAPGTPNRVVTSAGEVLARDVVLASNAALTGWPKLSAHLTNFSSFMVITEPLPDRTETIGWDGDEALDDARMFVHYFRKTNDGRIAMGSGSGRIGFGGNLQGLSNDDAAVARAENALQRLLPGLGNVAVTHAWGGALDVSADGLPFFGTLPGTRVHYGCGYSGHGVNATWIGGATIASLVLREENEWTRSIFCQRKVPSFPPEPLRYLGGQLIRSAIIACEEADEDERQPPLLSRAAAAIPQVFGIRVGARP